MKAPRTPRSHARDFLYRKIAADLRAKLRSGAIAPGARLPSLNEIAAEWGANRLTAMKAVEELRAAGLVVSVRAQGTFAAKREEPGAPAERAFTVGLLSRVLNPAGYGLYHQAMIAGLYDGLGPIGANLLVLAAGAEKPSELPAMMRRAHADAMVYMGAFEPELLAAMLREGPPAVVLDYDAGDLPVDGIRVDNAAVGRLAAGHLLACGVAPAELALVERVLGAHYPTPSEEAALVAKKMMATSLSDPTFDWTEAERLADLPDFRILPEFQTMKKEVEGGKA